MQPPPGGGVGPERLVRRAGRRNVSMSVGPVRNPVSDGRSRKSRRSFAVNPGTPARGTAG
jgi:hypothetical protein